MNNIKKISPWAWVPTLYFAQGIPYFIVNNISVLMFAKIGVPKGGICRGCIISGIYQSAVFTLDHQTFLEPVCRYHQNQKMVGCLHADSDVDSFYLADVDHTAAG